MSSTVVLIDGNSLIHRAYHALPPLSTADGQPTNAAFGFVQMILLLLQTQDPAVAVLALDSPEATFRDELFEAYKAHRPPMEEDLARQLPLVRELSEAMGLQCIAAPGYEADDIIGTLAREAAGNGREVLVVSSDRDLLQLVDERVKVMVTLRGIRDTRVFDPAGVQEEYGLPPAAIVDLKGLAGDSSDNIPGVPKVGPKTATDLLQKFGSVEGLYENLEAVDKPALRERLAEYEAQARLSKRLATIHTEAPLEPAILATDWPGLDVERLRHMLTALEFTSLLDRLPASAAPPATVDVCTTPEGLERLCQAAREAGMVGLAVARVGERLLGLALATPGGRAACFVDLEEETEATGLFAVEAAPLPQSVIALLAAPEVRKVGHDLKTTGHRLAARGLEIAGPLFDTAIAQYLIAPHRGEPALDFLIAQYLGEAPAQVSAEGAGGLGPQTLQAANEAAALVRLVEPLTGQLEALEQRKLYEQVELPLVRILGEMEDAGIGLDRARLGEIGERLGGLLAQHSARVYELAGESFNIDSPKQLAQILFEKLALPRGRKTKTGWSTDADVLEELAAEHEVVARVLDYRESSKLKSTYVEGLSRLAGPDGRVHTTFEQAVAATGRLASRNPNLQNIPIRTEWGREIRACFVAQGEGRVLLSADYSQIELRIMAHLSGEESLIEAFRAGEDIHRRTAAAIFGIPDAEVSSDQRRVAKTVNYAVTYGMGATALARSLSVPRAEAQQFIENYFARLPRVKAYLEAVVAVAREQGWVSTVLGRRRPVPDIRASNPGVRTYAERAAANTPLQGSAADIIKIAMVVLPPRLAEAAPECRMLLQVHDELLFELPREQMAAATPVIREVMEGPVRLDVPLVVEPKMGVNWRDTEPV